MAQVSFLTGPERRRRWSESQKLELVAQAFGPGGSAAETAWRADICRSLLYRWRRLQQAGTDPVGFAPAMLIEGPKPVAERHDGPAILVELAGGVRVTVTADAPAVLVAATLKALR
jgi:transposase